MPVKPQFYPADEVMIIKDLQGDTPGVVGRSARIESPLPPKSGKRQYKVLVFGGNGFIGGMFEVDEREIRRV